jgi:hypothetical protein
MWLWRFLSFCELKGLGLSFYSFTFSSSILSVAPTGTVPKRNGTNAPAPKCHRLANLL